MAGWLNKTKKKLMKPQYSLTALQHVFCLFLVTVVLVLSSALVGIIKHIESNVHVLKSSELIHLIQNSSRVALILLVVMIAVMVIVIFGYFFIIISAGKREMYLCASLIKQMEATQQAEKNSMNKSHDFASRSHSIRTALVSLASSIQISYNEVTPGSLIEQNLRDMEGCVQDLDRVLTRVLDKSKIEAGMAVLQEEEIDLAQLVENAVDNFHLAGLKKGLDVVLDHCDGSLTKFAYVVADGLKLKEILWNLLSNAVKYTPEGHVTVRAWARKPSLKNSIRDHQSRGFLKQFLCFSDWKRVTQAEVDHKMDATDEPKRLEFVFEVDDTGMGIPKEKKNSVFEDYTQLKDSGLGQGGTGLGLGNVRHMVHTMGGEIEIVDKEIGEKGTCFRFKVLLQSASEEGSKKLEQDIEMGGGDRLTCEARNQEFIGETSAGSPNPIRSPSLNTIRSTSTPSTPNWKSKAEGSSYVVLLIKNQERRRIVRKFIAESLGIKVLVVEQWEQLADTLKRRKQMKGYLHSRNNSLSGLSDLGIQDMPLMNTVDGTDNSSIRNNILSLFKKTPSRANLRGCPFTLAVIDTTAGPFPELWNIMNEFKRGLPKQNGCCCKVVWLDNPFSQRISTKMFDPDDVVAHKPLHGTRLYELVRLLPEFGDAIFQLPPKGSPKEISRAPSSSSRYHENRFESARHQLVHESSGLKTRELDINQSKPLTGKRFLVAEDVPVLRKVVMQTLSRFGATVVVCENGREAVDLVRDELVNQNRHGYDYILMDCQMPLMDGIEATKEIRKEEQPYGVCIPIIALTAHERGDTEVARMMEAGMDDHLDKTLKLDRLLEVISKIESRTTSEV